MSDVVHHRLLRRQLRRHFGPDFFVPAEWRDFIASVDAAYVESDSARGMLERSLELSSQELLQAGSQMRALLQGIPDLLVRFDAVGNVLELQAGAGAGSFAELGAFFGAKVADIRDEAVARQFHQALGRVAIEKAMVSIEYSVTCPKRTCYFEARLVPLLEGECLAIVRNITERKRAEAELRHAISVAKSTIESTADGILVVDLDGRIASFNRRFAEMWRVPTMLLEDGVDTVVLETGAMQISDPEAFKRRVRELYSHPDEESFDIVEFKDGRVFERTSRPRRLDGVPVGRVWSFHDITERRRSEERLLKLSRVVEQTAESVLITDCEGRIEYINPAFTVLTGYEPGDVLGRQPSLLRSGRHDDDFYKELWDTILAGEIFHAVLVNRKKNGELFHADTTITPIKDGAGRVTHFVSTEQDITAHRELEQQLRQAQKMEAFGQLAAGVAHDFNNLLTIILGNSALMQLEEGISSSQLEALGEIEQSAERAANLTQQLLTFSRRQPMQPVDLDLNEVLGRMMKMLGRLIGEHIAIDVRAAADGAPTHADPSMMEQLVLNLAVNARDAMPEGGRLVLETARVDLGSVPRRPDSAARPGCFVCLSVSDTGAGIEPENLPKIFEPFFTTKAVGSGTGLGLAAVFTIVEQHQGWIDVDSRVGEGTTFRLFLPRLPDSVAPKPIEARVRPGPRGQGAVLLVEDEPAVRRFMRNVLVAHGYGVVEAASGPVALELWRQRGAEIDILVTDMILPDGMGGAELARRLTEMRPDLKVLYCSGYSDEMLGENSPLRHGANFVAKPFLPEVFLQKVRAMLDGA